MPTHLIARLTLVSGVLAALAAPQAASAQYTITIYDISSGTPSQLASNNGSGNSTSITNLTATLTYTASSNNYTLDVDTSGKGVTGYSGLEVIATVSPSAIGNPSSISYGFTGSNVMGSSNGTTYVSNAPTVTAAGAATNYPNLYPASSMPASGTVNFTESSSYSLTFTVVIGAATGDSGVLDTYQKFDLDDSNTITPAPTPEPGSLALILMGLPVAAIRGMRRLRRS